MFQNAVNIMGRTAVNLTVSVTAASIQLTEGVYDVKCDVDVFVRFAKTKADAETVTTANGYPIAAGNIIPIRAPSEGFLGAIAGGAGTLKSHQVN